MHREAMHCGNHQVNITDGLLENLVGKSVISALTGFLSLIRTGNFFLRLLSVVGVAAMDRLHLGPGMPPEGAYGLWMLEHCTNINYSIRKRFLLFENPG